MSISIEKQGDDVFNVTVSGDTTTQHKVTVTDDVHRELTDNRASKDSLLGFSFKFLLDREQNTSILSSFEIIVIAKFFSDYRDEVKRWCD